MKWERKIWWLYPGRSISDKDLAFTEATFVNVFITFSYKLCDIAFFFLFILIKISLSNVSIFCFRSALRCSLILVISHSVSAFYTSKQTKDFRVLCFLWVMCRLYFLVRLFSSVCRYDQKRCYNVEKKSKRKLKLFSCTCFVISVILQFISSEL